MGQGVAARRYDLSVVIPVFNEEELVKESISTILDELNKTAREFEVILIDDGSSDRTWAEIVKIINSNSGLHAIRFSRNFGKEAAIRAGILNAKGAAIIVMDCDLQHPPALIRQMLEKWDEGYDIVDAVKSDRGSESSLYKLASLTFSEITERLTGLRLRGSSDFKLISRRVADVYTNLPEYSLFYRGMTEWMGFRHALVSMKVQERKAGLSKWTPVRLTRLAVTALTSFTSLPLQIVSLMGGFLVLVSCGIACVVFYQWIEGTASSGFPTVILLQLFIGGSIMLSLGVIGEYISQIYYEVKRRPPFIVLDEVYSPGEMEAEERD